VPAKLIAEITPESLPPLVHHFQARCLTVGCYLSLTPVTAKYAESAQSSGEAHVRNMGHTVVIEESE